MKIQLEELLTRLPEGRHWPFHGRIHIDVSGTLSKHEQRMIGEINAARQYDLSRTGNELRIMLYGKDATFRFRYDGLSMRNGAVHFEAKYHGLPVDVSFFQPARHNEGTVYLAPGIAA